MARYKVGIAIDALRDRFGQDRSCFANLEPSDRYPREAIKVAEGAIADARAFIRRVRTPLDLLSQSPRSGS